MLTLSTTVSRSVNRVLRLVILYTVETSIVTSVGATAGVVMYALLPSTQIYTAMLRILPHLILSSLLVALNARAGLRERQRSVIVLSPIVRSRASNYRSVDITQTWQSCP
ncbi:hypothetical protein DAEQUDRAFT_178358 [Daedalea quercina L-15889]|uniref:DUF6534 domain-containing protein n=1 Tax=Daedalea quercina L-15889 TaxID=1314783 RepID=A0A165RDS1_9APHY|nr:hypothetical protein DAEQUDRAFT_178358 [Daedalea quercina L-15889]